MSNESPDPGDGSPSPDTERGPPTDRTKHLEMLQGVIGRMAKNSFQLKGWSVTLVSALIALTVKEKTEQVIVIALVPCVLFWLLDGYYQWQERLFRKLYEAVNGEIDGVAAASIKHLSMKTGPVKSHASIWAALVSPTVAFFHLALGVAAYCAILAVSHVA